MEQDYNESLDSLEIPEDTEEQVEQQNEDCEDESTQVVGDSMVSDDEEKPVKRRTRRRKSTTHKDNYKEKTCEVVYYNAKKKTLDIRFDGYGIRLKNIDKDVNSDEVVVQYKGEIGKPDFQCKLG